jgi:hypothetical protein
MPATYEPIATTSGTDATISFTSIPSTYTDLRLVIVTTKNPNVYINDDFGSTYSNTWLEGSGSSAISARSTGDSSWRPYNYVVQSGSNRNMIIMDIFSYAGSTNKTALTEFSNDANGSGYVTRYVSLWRSTAAINKLTVTNIYTATLYGIKNA